MDSIEKKVRELYQQKKREDEKFIPGFDAFRDKPERVNHVKHSYFLFKVAASVVLIMATGLYYSHIVRTSGKETVKVYPVNIDRDLPTQSLLDQSAGAGYIWNWKAPTDQLLKDATKSLKTEL